MNIPKAPLYGAFARAWALAEQGIKVSFETATERHFKATVSYEDPRLPHGGGGRVWGDDPDNLLDQIEDTLETRGVQFTRSTRYIEEVNGLPQFGTLGSGSPHWRCNCEGFGDCHGMDDPHCDKCGAKRPLTS